MKISPMMNNEENEDLLFKRYTNWMRARKKKKLSHFSPICAPLIILMNPRNIRKREKKKNRVQSFSLNFIVAWWELQNMFVCFFFLLLLCSVSFPPVVCFNLLLFFKHRDFITLRDWYVIFCMHTSRFCEMSLFYCRHEITLRVMGEI